MSKLAKSDTVADTQNLLGRLQRLQTEAIQKGSEPELLEQIFATRRSALQVLQDFDQPLRVGIVGAFSSGKTRLVEALLGCTGFLNVGEVPSTGNIVEFELVDSNEELADLGDYRVVIMDEPIVATRLMHQFAQTARGLVSAEADRLGQELQATLQSLSEARIRWAVAQKWASDVHVKCKGKGLKALAFEIYRLAYAVGQGRAYLGREFTISAEQATDLMSLKNDPATMFDRPLDSLRGEFSPAPQDADLSKHAASKIELLFPLVEKIKVKARLPSRIREFFGQGHMRLVDCPGAGADGSNYRDGVLCAHELQHVDSVLVLLSARNPGQNREFLDSLLRTWGDRAKDRIVAVVSRFDQLPYNKLGDNGRVDDSPVTSTKLLSSIPELKNVLEAALDTVMDGSYDRIVFTSTMGYLSYCLDKDRKGIRGRSNFYRQEMKFDPETQDESTIDQLVTRHPWVTEMQRWQEISQRLDIEAKTESRSLANILSEFAEDGGIERLRRILQLNLDRHGRRNLMQRLDRQLDELEQKMVVLEATVEKLVVKPVSSPSVQSAGSKGEYRMMASDLTRAYQKIEKVLKEQRNASGFKLMRFKGTEASELRPVIESNLIYQIAKWPQWRLLMERILPDGTVKLVDPKNPEFNRFPSRLQKELDTPVKSTDFYESFCETVSWCNTLIQKYKAENDSFFRGDFARRHIAEALGGRAAVSRAKELFGAEREHWLSFSNLCEEEATGPLPKEEIAPFFPLQKESEFYYPWHKPLADGFGKQFGARKRHLMYVIRIRQTIIDAALLWLDNAFERIEQELCDRISEDVNCILEELLSVAEPEITVPGSIDDDLLG